MIKDVIKKVVSGKDLAFEETSEVMEEILTGKCTDIQIAGLITALAAKGESPDEIAGAVKILREKADRLNVTGDILDTCGTGGDCAGTINVSTAAGLTASACGVKVAKHGNRSVSSSCGSADILKSLGVKIECPKPVTEKCIEEIGFGFIFAPLYHSAMKYAMPARRDLGIRTIFNIAGPLSNPAFPAYQLVGVFSKDFGQKMAEVLKKNGTKHALVVTGADGLDEVSPCGPTHVHELSGGNISSYDITPKDFGIKRIDSLIALRPETPEDNIRMFISAIKGEAGPVLDFIAINAACGIFVSGRAGNLKEAFHLASDALHSGKVFDKLQALIKLTNL